MDQQAFDSYLEAQVLTATPQKLRLMLIDATISAARQALKHWEDEQNEQALMALVHCRSLLAELLSGIKSVGNELSSKVAGVYVFLFKTLTDAQSQRDPKLVEDTIRVLQVERDTWSMVCEQMPTAPLPAGGTDESLAEITAANCGVSTVPNSAPATGGLVLDA